MLTNSVETLTGTSGNDTFNAIVDAAPGATVLSTLNSGDSINGGAGTDRLNVTYTGTTGNPVVDLTSVEQVYLRPLVNSTQSAATWTGVEQIWADRSGVGNTLNVTNVASKDVVFGLNQVQGDNSVARSEVQTVAVTGAATAGTYTFLGQAVTGATAADSAATVAGRITTDKVAIIAAYNAVPGNAGRQLADISNTGATITLTYVNTAGDVANTTAATNDGVTFAASVETVKGAAAAGTVELTAGVVASQLTGTTDKLNLAVVDSGRVEQVAATESVAAIYSYAQVAATAGYEQLAVAATGTKASAIDATGVGAALTTLEVAGTQAVEVLVNNTALKTVTVTNTAGSTVSLAGSTQNVTATLAGGNDTLTTGSGNDNITASGGNNTINAGTGNDVVTTGAGNDTITVGAGSVNVNAGDGNNVVIVAGLEKTDVIKSGAGTTDVLGLTVTDAVAASANDTAGAELRATYSGFETLRITDAIAAQTVEAGRLGFANSVQINNTVGGAANLNGIASGATITVRSASTADWAGSLAIGMTDAAANSNDQLNINLRSNLLVADNNLGVSFGISGINKVKLDGADATNFAGDDGQALDANKDNGPDDGYTVALVNAANLNTVEITGSSFISYTSDATSNALKLVDASASTGNSVISVAAFTGTERVEIKGSQGTNSITGSDVAFGEKITGGAKNDIIDAGQGADAVTGNGGRDIFKVTTGDSIATSMDKISDFGKVTEAVLAADVNAMNSDAAFQSATTGKGGANADLIDFVTAPTLGAAAAAASVVATLENIEVGDQFAGKEITVTESAKGILTLGGADKAMVDTLTEWLHIANFSAGTGGNVVGFEFNGNTYVFQQVTTTANHISDDNVIELTGVTGVTGITLIGNNAAAIGDILIG